MDTKIKESLKFAIKLKNTLFVVFNDDAPHQIQRSRFILMQSILIAMIIAIPISEKSDKPTMSYSIQLHELKFNNAIKANPNMSISEKAKRIINEDIYYKSEPKQIPLHITHVVLYYFQASSYYIMQFFGINRLVLVIFISWLFSFCVAFDCEYKFLKIKEKCGL